VNESVQGYRVQLSCRGGAKKYMGEYIATMELGGRPVVLVNKSSTEILEE